MTNKASDSCRSRRMQRERQRREPRPEQRREHEEASLHEAASLSQADNRARRAAATACGWCGGPITPRGRGPIPKWCSATCRHRAWEQARAAASGRSAIQVVERRVEVSTRIAPGRRDWPRLLGDLVRQLNDGQIYDRDLPEVRLGLEDVTEAYNRRASYGRPSPASASGWWSVRGAQRS